MTHTEGLALAVALLALQWRQRWLVGARGWLAAISLLALGGLVYVQGPTVVQLGARVLLAAAIARIVAAPRRAQAAVAGAVLAMSWSADEAAGLGLWPVVTAAALLAVGLPPPASMPSDVSAAAR